jgi:hypothetical protein
MAGFRKMTRPGSLGSSMDGLPVWFIPFWCAVMPLTSFLLIPSLQGSIPAYVLGFVSILFVLLIRRDGQPSIQRFRYFKIALLMAGIWMLLLVGSQFGHLLSNRQDFGDIYMIDPEDPRVLLRKALFTQTLYLAACLSIALFFRFFFREDWMRYVLWGGWLLAIYGIYEWLFFLVFKQTGDFLVNRTYGEGLQSASWSQIIQVGPFSLLRIKSTFGEPSFFSAGVIPYLLLALAYKRKWLTAALLFCIVFSTSSSAYLALPFALLLHALFQRKLNSSVITVILLFAVALTFLYFAYPETFDSMFTSKLSGENDSGHIRQKSAEAMNETAQTFTFMNHLFGIGFGYLYSGVFYTILVNTGWIGMIVYCYAFLKPVIYLRADPAGLALKVGIATLFFLFYISVSELFLPTTWMFLGLAYWRLDRQREEKEAAQPGILRTPVSVG